MRQLLAFFLAPVLTLLPVTAGAAQPQLPAGQPPVAQQPPAPQTPAPQTPVPQTQPGQTPPSTTPTPTAAAPLQVARTFTGKTGMIFNTVRPDRVGDFEKVLGYLSFQKTTRASPRSDSRSVTKIRRPVNGAR